MPLLAPIDAETIAIVDKARWHVVDTRTSAPRAWGRGEKVPGRGGAWEISADAVRWKAEEGAARASWSGAYDAFATDGVDLWVRVGERVDKVGSDVTVRAPGALVIGADAGGMSWASRERVTRVGADGRQTCSVEVQTEPVAVAANANFLALADPKGLLLIGLEKCQVVAAGTAVAAAITWSGDTLYAVTSGGLQSFDTSLDAPAGYRLGFVGLDGAAPGLFVGSGLYQLGGAGFTPLPPTAAFTDRVVLTSDDHRYAAFDAAGKLLAEDDALPLPVAAFDAHGNHVAVTDGTTIRMLGVGTVRPGGAIRTLEVLDDRRVAFLDDEAWSIVDLKAGKTTPSAPPGPAAFVAGSSWVPLDATVTDALRRVSGGVEVVEPRTGRSMGVPMAIPLSGAADVVRVSGDRRLVVHTDGKRMSAWSSATGARLWEVPETGTVTRVGHSVIELAGSGEKVRSRDPATGAAIEGDFAALVPEHRAGGALPAWSGAASPAAAPAVGAPAVDPAGLFARFAPLFQWPMPKSHGGWCGRASVAKEALAGWPALQERVGAVLAACPTAAPTLVAERPATADVRTNEACSGTIWVGGEERALPFGGRDLLVTTATNRPPLLPDDLDVVLLTDDPTQAQRWSRPPLVGSPRQPLPACLAAIADSGAAWIGKDGRVRARGLLGPVAQALRAGDSPAPMPKLRVRTVGPLRGVRPVDGGTVVIGDLLVARLDAEGRTKWTVRGGGTMVDVVGDMVVRIDGNRVRALDLADGRSLWETAARYVGADGDAVIIADRGVQRAVTRDGKVKWSHAGPGVRVGGGLEATVAGWSCRRDARTLEVQTCGRVEVGEAPYTLEKGLFRFVRSRKERTDLTDARAVRSVGRRFVVDRGGLGAWVLSEDGRIEAVLPPTPDVRADARHLYAHVDGQLEVYDL